MASKGGITRAACAEAFAARAAEAAKRGDYRTAAKLYRAAVLALEGSELFEPRVENSHTEAIDHGLALVAIAQNSNDIEADQAAQYHPSTR